MILDINVMVNWLLENKMTVDYYHVAKSRAKLCFLEDDRLPATGFDRIADSSQAMKKGVREKGQVQKSDQNNLDRTKNCFLSQNYSTFAPISVTLA